MGTTNTNQQFPIGSRWVLPDGRRVQVTRSPYWLESHTVTLFVENRRRGGRRETAFRADRLALIAKPFVRCGHDFGPVTGCVEGRDQ